MNIELTVYGNALDPLVVNFDDEAVGADSDRCVWLGRRRYIEPGVFRNDWLIQYMDANEVRNLIAALQFALERLPAAYLEEEKGDQA